MSVIWAVLQKDLRVESRSKIVTSQVLPFALIVLILFGLALDADRAALRSFTPGLFWVTVLFASTLAVQRSVAVESETNAFEALRLTGAAAWQVFAGKACALAVQLLAVEAVLTLGVIIWYRSAIANPVLVVTAALAATIAIACAGSLYGVLAVGEGVRDTVLPLLLLPVLTPVLVAATRAFDDGINTAAVNGWSWTLLLGAFAAAYAVVGSLAYAVVMEDA